MADETDDADISQTAETVALDATDENIEEGIPAETQEESLGELDLIERLAQAEEYGRNQKIRAEKAERKTKDTPEQETSEPKAEPKGESKDLTSKDTIALINAKVHEDDIDEVVEYAKFKGTSVSEVLKSSVIKGLLTERSEHRATAEATNTGKTRPGTTRASGETLLKKASKTGEMPDRAEDLDALLEERYKVK